MQDSLCKLLFRYLTANLPFMLLSTPFIPPRVTDVSFKGPHLKDGIFKIFLQNSVFCVNIIIGSCAAVAELADALDSKSSG